MEMTKFTFFKSIAKTINMQNNQVSYRPSSIETTLETTYHFHVAIGFKGLTLWHFPHLCIKLTEGLQEITFNVSCFYVLKADVDPIECINRCSTPTLKLL